MPTYLIEVEETTRRTYVVHAADRHEAWRKATHPSEWQDNGDSPQRIDFEVQDVMGPEVGVDDMDEWKYRRDA